MLKELKRGILYEQVVHNKAKTTDMEYVTFISLKSTARQDLETELL
jgi:hypothetical protein